MFFVLGFFLLTFILQLIKAMEGLEKVDPESRFILHHEAALGQRTIQSIVDSMLATTAAGEGEGGSDAEDAQLEDFAATIPRATEAEVAAAWENLHQQTNTVRCAYCTEHIICQPIRNYFTIFCCTIGGYGCADLRFSRFPDQLPGKARRPLYAIRPVVIAAAVGDVLQSAQRIGPGGETAPLCR